MSLHPHRKCRQVARCGSALARAHPQRRVSGCCRLGDTCGSGRRLVQIGLAVCLARSFAGVRLVVGAGGLRLVCHGVAAVGNAICDGLLDGRELVAELGGEGEPIPGVLAGARAVAIGTPGVALGSGAGSGDLVLVGGGYRSKSEDPQTRRGCGAGGV
jgi:hypothetical protein